MPRVIGYGEDALTYWALTRRLESILHELQDESIPSACLVAYRPSFGRRGGPDRAEFGEFDAILASPHSVYLVESKWDHSRNVKHGVMTLRHVQELRHRIFLWYFRRWNRDRFPSWSSFVEKHGSEFSEEFGGKKIAPPESKVSRNLEYVLNQLHSYSEEICNVLLFFKREGSFSPTRIPRNFRLVTIDYQDVPGGNYFDMTQR